MATVYQVAPASAGITCHAWNADQTMLAMCPNNEELQIYEGCASKSFSGWKRAHVLTEHDMVISGMSWSPVSNKIVTCSHDRNAFVWTYKEASGVWEPTLCVLRIDRAALDVRWSPDGSKFAVASGSKSVAISHYENSQGNDWYVSKMIKKHKSTVLKVAWHPNSQTIATGCSDYRCRVISAFVPEVDGTPNAGELGRPLGFGEVYADFPCSGWVTAVAWSPSGSQLAFAGQDSTLHVVRFQQGTPTQRTVRYPLLPLTCMTFLSENAIVGGGHDMNPLLFSSDSSDNWGFVKAVDDKADTSGPIAAGVSKIQAARAMFQAKTTRGQGSSVDIKGDIGTKHNNPITSIEPMGRPNDSSYSRFSTAGTDGRLVVWELSTLNIDMAALGIS